MPAAGYGERRQHAISLWGPRLSPISSIEASASCMDMQVGTEKVGERRIFRGLCHMQVWHMQLIDSLREGIATGVPALLLESQSDRRFFGTAGVDTFSL
jgi:hypothetical protein